MSRDEAYQWCKARQVTIQTGIQGKDNPHTFKVLLGTYVGNGAELEDAVSDLCTSAHAALQQQVAVLGLPLA